MFYLSTKAKIYIANILSKILIFFLSEKKRVILRNNIKYEIDLNEAIDLGIFLGVKNEEERHASYFPCLSANNLTSLCHPVS